MIAVLLLWWHTGCTLCYNMSPQLLGGLFPPPPPPPPSSPRTLFHPLPLSVDHDEGKGCEARGYKYWSSLGAHAAGLASSVSACNTEASTLLVGLGPGWQNHNCCCYQRLCLHLWHSDCLLGIHLCPQDHCLALLLEPNQDCNHCCGWYCLCHFVAMFCRNGYRTGLPEQFGAAGHSTGGQKQQPGCLCLPVQRLQLCWPPSAGVNALLNFTTHFAGL